MARPAGGRWALGRGLQPLAPLGSARERAAALGAPPSGGLSPGPPRLYRCDDCAGPSTRRRGVKKNGGQATQALGRSRGGWSTTIPAGCRDEHLSVAFVLTAGQGHESPGCETVCAPLPPEQPLTQAMMDKGYDSNRIREQLLAQDMVPVIPPKSNRTASSDYAPDLYKLREQVERFFNTLKPFCRIATR